MKPVFKIIILFFLVFLFSSFCKNMKLYAQKFPISDINQEFDLVADRSNETQYYKMETKVVNYSLDGKRYSTEIYLLYLKCEPKYEKQKGLEEYTCKKYVVQLPNKSPMHIKSLEDWKYTFYPILSGKDDKGQVFGIDHSKFDKLSDEIGKPLQPGTRYFIYNSFIDFHAFCNIFAKKSLEGKGLQDLKLIGQKIVHGAAFTEPPVNLGSEIKEGSTFKNGEITLEFKGLSMVKDKVCAIITFDSGESSFKMIMEPMPKMEVTTIGSSHYLGDIYIDLNTRWVKKVTLNEFVLSETKMSTPPYKINAVTERFLTIEAITQEEFEQ